MIPCQRHLFDIPGDVAYLNCAYMSPLMKPALEAGTAALNRKAQPWQITPDQFFTGSEEFRATAAQFLDCSADCIAIVPSASYGIATAARNLPVNKGQSILVLEEQFPSNYYAWQRLAEANGAPLKIAPWPEDNDWTAAVLNSLTPDVAIAALPHVQWTSGGRLDLVRIGEACRKLGAALVLEADVAVLHQSVKVLRDIKLRADFEVYFKAFLMSLDIILPNPAANRFRVPAKRFGYLLRMTKERYKDESLDLGDAGEKVKRLINEHLISLGINPKVPPVELLAPDFVEQLQAHSAGNAEAKASEMEHAVRKHCTIHFDEDPAFYKRLSEKLEEIIKRHREQWDVLSEELLHLRVEAAAGRKAPIEGLDKEQSTFYEHLADLVFGASVPPPDRTEALKKLAAVIVECLQETIGIIDFWNNPAEQHRLRGEIADALLMADIPEVTAKYERLAVELLKLARNRHRQLIERIGV